MDIQVPDGMEISGQISLTRNVHYGLLSLLKWYVYAQSENQHAKFTMDYDPDEVNTYIACYVPKSAGMSDEDAAEVERYERIALGWAYRENRVDDKGHPMVMQRSVSYKNEIQRCAVGILSMLSAALDGEGKIRILEQHDAGTGEVTLTCLRSTV